VTHFERRESSCEPSFPDLRQQRTRYLPNARNPLRHNCINPPLLSYKTARIKTCPMNVKMVRRQAKLVKKTIFRRQRHASSFHPFVSRFARMRSIRVFWAVRNPAHVL